MESQVMNIKYEYIEYNIKKGITTLIGLWYFQFVAITDIFSSK